MVKDRDKGRATGSTPRRAGKGKASPRKKVGLADSTAYEVLSERRISITIGGIEREVPAISAAKQRTFQAALNGGRTAHRDVLKWIREREEARPRQRKQFPQILAEYSRPADVDQAMVILGLAAPLLDRERPDERPFLQLEPWIVRKALARAGSKKLTESELAEVRRHTRVEDDAPSTWEAPDER
jgi:hypothetical protein